MASLVLPASSYSSSAHFEALTDFDIWPYCISQSLVLDLWALIPDALGNPSLHSVFLLSGVEGGNWKYF